MKNSTPVCTWANSKDNQELQIKQREYLEWAVCNKISSILQQQKDGRDNSVIKINKRVD